MGPDTNFRGTAAPWAKPATPVESLAVPSGHTGRPVEALIKSNSELPETINISDHKFLEPKSEIHSDEQLKRFIKSAAAKKFVGFILAANESVRSLSNKEEVPVSPILERVLKIFDKLDAWIDEFPPIEQSLRYGNPAFRKWFEKLDVERVDIISDILPEEFKEASPELSHYFLHSFGNKIRIDYGTGHETTFCAFLYCLSVLGLIKKKDLSAVVLKVFMRYIELARRLQTTYWLEPAGSHGVWGLDDYQFLTFVWGSNQLIGHDLIKPASIHAAMTLDSFSDDYMYIGCVTFVKSVKKGPLQETSPILCDIANVPAWEKVNSGLIKMYQVEVLSKLPIMQHFLFGSLLNWSDAQ